MPHPYKPLMPETPEISWREEIVSGQELGNPNNQKY